MQSQRTALTEAYYTLKATKKAKQWIRVFYDGEDWLHLWRAGGFVSPRPLKRPIFECATSIPSVVNVHMPQLRKSIFDVSAFAGTGTELQAI